MVDDPSKKKTMNLREEEGKKIAKWGLTHGAPGLRVTEQLL
jgi:hypothetical protein